MGTPGKRHQQADFIIRIVTDNPTEQAQVALIHADKVVVMGVVGWDDATGCPMGIERHAMLAQTALRRGIDGIAAFLVGHGSGSNLKPMGHATGLDKGFHDKFRHGRTADITVTDEEDFSDFHSNEA